jgi:hypothetical protein
MGNQINTKNNYNNENNNKNENFITFGGYSPTNNEQNLSAFSGILQETALKVGCCKRASNDNSAQIANVRVPIDLTNPIIASEYKYDFKFEKVKIPAGACPVDVYADSHICNAFYDVYCENIFQNFNNTNLPKEKLLDYAPECACYIPKTAAQKYYPAGIPAACYKSGCNIVDSEAYLDTASRNTQCNLKICQNIFNANNITASGNVTIDPILQNTCGKYLNQPTPSPTPTPTPTPVPSSSNTMYYIIIAICLIVLCSSAVMMKKKKKK